MFSKHAVQFDRLVHEGMPIRQVEILKSILTNPDSDLEHHGNIVVTKAIASPDLKSARWAIANTNWQYDDDPPSQGGPIAYVHADECEDPVGKRKTGHVKKIYLPVSPSQDPNVEEGDVIMFFASNDGSYTAVGYGDARIGSLLHSTQTERAIKGWALMDGTNNSKEKGGSGIDGKDRFLRQWNASSSSGTTGGATSSSLTIEGTVSATDIGNHSHTLSQSTIGTGSESTVDVVTGTPTGDSGIDLSNVSVTFTGAGGSGSPSASSVPPYVYVAVYERLNNSNNRLQ